MTAEWGPPLPSKDTQQELEDALRQHEAVYRIRQKATERIAAEHEAMRPVVEAALPLERYLTEHGLSPRTLTPALLERLDALVNAVRVYEQQGEGVE